MKFEDALHSCKCGARIRHESLPPGEVIVFSVGQRPGGTVPRDPSKRVGDYFAVHLTTGASRLHRFTSAQREADDWATIA